MIRRCATRPARRQRRGTVAVWLAVSLTAIIGVVALGLDGGRMMDERRHARAAADAAALAAAVQATTLVNQGSSVTASGVTGAAVQSAADNGYPASAVTVNLGPKSGTFAGRNDCIEVLVNTTVPATFGRIFTATDPAVQGRAVAKFQPVKPGVSTMAATGSGTVAVNQQGVLKIKSGTVVVNSSDAQAYQVTGTADAEAVSHQVVGGYTQAAGATIVGPVNTGVAPTPDALANMPPPSLVGMPVQSATPLNVKTNTTLQPGLYTGGIALSGTANVTLAPGVYYINGGGLNVPAGTTLTGTGVTIYNTGGGAVHFGSSNLTAPTTGPYANVLFFQDRLTTLKIDMGAADQLQINGILYGPSLNLHVGMGASITGTGQGAVVSNTLLIDGTGAVNLDLGGGSAAAVPNRLVE